MAKLDTARQRLSAIETVVLPVLERTFSNLDDESIRAHQAYRAMAAEESRRYGDSLELKRSDQRLAGKLARKGFSADAIASALRINSRNEAVRDAGSIESYAQAIADASTKDSRASRGNRETARGDRA